MNWNWYHQHSRVFDWQHICYLWWTCFSTDNRHTYWVQTVHLFSPTCSFICMKQTSYKVSREKRKSFNFTFSNIDDVLSLNNSRFSDFVERIYPNELEIKDITDTDRSASYLDLYIEIVSEGRLRTKL